MKRVRPGSLRVIKKNIYGFGLANSPVFLHKVVTVMQGEIMLIVATCNDHALILCRVDGMIGWRCLKELEEYTVEVFGC